jgi:hypothetical protein
MKAKTKNLTLSIDTDGTFVVDQENLKTGFRHKFHCVFWELNSLIDDDFRNLLKKATIEAMLLSSRFVSVWE